MNKFIFTRWQITREYRINRSFWQSNDENDSEVNWADKRSPLNQILEQFNDNNNYDNNNYSNVNDNDNDNDNNDDNNNDNNNYNNNYNYDPIDLATMSWQLNY